MIKYFLVTGLWRQATKWLYHMINNHVRINGAPIHSRNRFVNHELLFRYGLVGLGRMKRFCSDPGVVGSVGPEGHLLTDMHKAFPDVKVVNLIREPITHLMSVSTIRAVNNGSLLRHAVQWWAARDHELRLAKEAGIHIHHMHMDYYTTEKGFRELMRLLDLEVAANVTMLEPVNPTVAHNKHTLDTFQGDGEELEKRLLELYNSFEYLTEAHAAAKRGPDSVPDGTDQAPGAQEVLRAAGADT